jgi:small subunit ribosomal protein S1
MMSDNDKSDIPSSPLPEEPAAAPSANSGKVPSLEHEQSYGGGARFQSFDAEIERELKEAMGDLSDKDMYGEPGQPKKSGAPPAGQSRKKGKVLNIHGPDVFVDVPGGRSQGILSMTQFPDGPPAIGAEVEFEIEGYDHNNGLLLLTRHGAATEADWSTVAVGQIVEARVTGTNKGGLSVDVNGIRGFLPISQIDIYRVENVEQYVNQKLLCQVTEADRQERNLVVSRRNLLEKEREEMREKLWGQLAEGQTRQGVVRSIKEFGAFVDLGGVDGLLHVSEMSWQRVKDPSTLVQLGQSVQVVILKIDQERRKLSLGMKQLTISPWDDAAAKYPFGAIVDGKVTRLMDFGAFVELEPAIEGLIHISELAPQRVHRVRDIVQAGQEVKVMVLNVDPGQRRISLSLKAALPKEPEATADEEAAEEDAPVRPSRPRTTPLRGGIGGN